MSYKMEFALCALIIQLAVCYRFFSEKRFSSKQNRLFSAVLIIAAVDLFLDIISSLMIDFALSYPYWLTYSINTVFYMLQLLLPLLLVLYVIVIIKDYRITTKLMLLIIVPWALFEMFVMTNFVHKAIFYIDTTIGYVHNSGFYYLYYGAIIYIIIAFIFLFRYRKHIIKRQYRVFMSFIWIVILTMALQYLFPEYLLTGVAVSLFIYVVYFSMQNPSEMLDSFTKAFNTEAMHLFIYEKLSDNTNFQLIVVNIDGMRKVNNLFGALIGNELMFEISKYIQSIKNNPWVFKLQRSQFVIITLNPKDQERILTELCSRLSKSWYINNLELMVEVNIRYFDESSTFKRSVDIFNLIDIAYENNILIQDSFTISKIDQSLIDRVNRQNEIENALRFALDNQCHLEIHFQPIYSLKDKCFRSLEALIRYTGKELGNISPGEFIPIAEKSGLIIKMDEFVINETLTFIRKYNIKKKYNIDKVSINLSAAEFINQGFTERFKAIYDNHKTVDISMLIFEVTETAATISYDIINEAMATLKKYGITFALDDFGKGYANLSEVANLSFNIVKLDRSLLKINISEIRSDILFTDLLNMFKKLGMKIVVEGVETIADLQKVIELEPDYIQGYYYAKPMHVRDLLLFLKQNKSSN